MLYLSGFELYSRLVPPENCPRLLALRLWSVLKPTQSRSQGLSCPFKDGAF